MGVSNWQASLPLVLRVWRIGSMFFHSLDSRRKARLLLLAVLILCAISAGMLVILSYIQRDFSTALSNKDVKGFYRAAMKFIAVVMVATPLFAYYEYIQEWLALEWRIWFTNLLLSDYFVNRAYFNLKVEGKLDNPDQRICEDISSFVKNAVDIITLTCSKFLKICAFTGVLWSIAPELVFFLLIYSTLGSFLTIKFFGQKIMKLKFQGLQREADFRYSLVRIRDNAESIAFYRGEGHESSLIKNFFSVLVSNTRELILWTYRLSFFSNAYEFTVLVVPSLIVAPKYFAGKLEFGVISQSGFAFTSILSALSVIILKFDNLSGLAAQTERLDSLLLALGNHNENSKLLDCYLRKSRVQLEVFETSSSTPLLNLYPVGYISREEGPGLVIKGLCVTTPNLRTLLIKDLTLSVEPGESLLIVGSSGCGKSSFLRAIAGLWNRGDGLIRGYAANDTFFLPQKPYMPLGTLREQLLFPSILNSYEHLDDNKLLRSLHEVHLEDLPVRVGGLDAKCDWTDVLSSGEQQRLGFARLLLHQPKMAFLDEASSALDPMNESLIYSLLQQRVTCYVSVGHRLSLLKYHTHVLKFDDNYEWKLCSKKDFENLTSL